MPAEPAGEEEFVVIEQDRQGDGVLLKVVSRLAESVVPPLVGALADAFTQEDVLAEIAAEGRLPKRLLRGIVDVVDKAHADALDHFYESGGFGGYTMVVAEGGENVTPFGHKQGSPVTFKYDSEMLREWDNLGLLIRMDDGSIFLHPDLSAKLKDDVLEAAQTVVEKSGEVQESQEGQEGDPEGEDVAPGVAEEEEEVVETKEEVPERFEPLTTSQIQEALEREIVVLVKAPPTIANSRRTREVRRQLRLLKSDYANYGLIPGGARNGSYRAMKQRERRAAFEEIEWGRSPPMLREYVDYRFGRRYEAAAWAPDLPLFWWLFSADSAYWPAVEGEAVAEIRWLENRRGVEAQRRRSHIQDWLSSGGIQCRLVGGADDGETKGDEPSPAPPGGSDGSITVAIPQLYHVPRVPGLTTMANTEAAFAQGMEPMVASINGERLRWYRTGPVHYWFPVSTSDAGGVTLWSPGILEVQPTGDIQPSGGMVVSGIYGKAIAYASGAAQINEVSTDLRTDLTQASGNTETQHASIYGTKVMSKSIPSTVRIPFVALQSIFATSRLDHSPLSLWPGALKLNMARGAEVVHQDCPLRTLGVAPPTTLLLRVMTMSEFVSLLAGRIEGEVGFTVRDVMNAREDGCAVVPMRVAWSQEARVNMAWLLAHLEWPWATATREDTVDQTGLGPVRRHGYTTSHFVRVPGATRAILVIADVSTIGGGDYPFDFSSPNFPPIQVSRALNGNEPGGVDADVYALSNDFPVGRDVSSHYFWRAMQRWSLVGGNHFDWDTAWATSMELYAFQPTTANVLISGNGTSQSYTSADGTLPPLVPGTAVNPAGNNRVTATFPNRNYTVMSGQLGWMHGGAYGNQMFRNQLVKLPEIDPGMWAGLVARYYHVEKDDWVPPGSVYELILAMANAVPRAWAVCDQIARRRSFPLFGVLAPMGGTTIVNDNLMARRRDLKEMVEEAFHHSPASRNAFSINFQSTNLNQPAGPDVHSVRSVASNRVPFEWLPGWFVPVEDSTVAPRAATRFEIANNVNYWLIGGKRLDVSLTSPDNELIHTLWQTFTYPGPGLAAQWVTHTTLGVSSGQWISAVMPGAALLVPRQAQSLYHQTYAEWHTLEACSDFAKAVTQGTIALDAQWSREVSVTTTSPSVFRTMTHRDLPVVRVGVQGNVWLEPGVAGDRPSLYDSFRALPL